MSKKLYVFRTLDKDCVNPASREFVKDYIKNLITMNEQLVAKVEKLKQEKHELFKKRY